MSQEEMNKNQLIEYNKSAVNYAEKTELRNKELALELDKARDDKREMIKLIANKSIQLVSLILVLFIIRSLITELYSSPNGSQYSDGVFGVCGALATGFLKDMFSGFKN